MIIALWHLCFTALWPQSLSEVTKKKNNPTRQREPSFQPFPSTSFGLWPAGEHFPDQSHFRASIGFPSGACLYAVGSCRSLNLRQPCPSLENTHCSKTNDWGNCFPSVSHQHTTQNYLTEAKRGPHFYSLAGHLNVNGGWLDCTATCAKEYADRMENCRRKEEKVASMKKRFARESKLDVENRERKCWAKAGRKTMICGDTRVAVWSARTSFNLPMPSRWDSVCAMCVRECVLHNHLEWFSSQPEQTGTPDRPPPPSHYNKQAHGIMSPCSSPHRQTWANRSAYPPSVHIRTIQSIQQKHEMHYQVHLRGGSSGLLCVLLCSSPSQPAETVPYK